MTCRRRSTPPPSDLPGGPADAAVFPEVQPGGGADHDDRADLRHAVAWRQVYDVADSHAGTAAVAGGTASPRCSVNGAEKPAVRVRLDPAAHRGMPDCQAQDVYNADPRRQRRPSRLGSFEGPEHCGPRRSALNRQMSKCGGIRATLVIKSVNGAVVRLSDIASVVDGVANCPAGRLVWEAAGDPADADEIRRCQRHRHGRQRDGGAAAAAESWMPTGHQGDHPVRPD